MFEKFLSGNARDFRQRYEGTYGFFQDENGKRTFCCLTGINDRTCTFTDGRGVEYILNADSEKNVGFRFVPPQSCYYNLQDGTVSLACRVATRQWSRGVNHKNTTIYKLVEGGLLPTHINFKSLEPIYLKSVTPQEAAAKFGKGKVLAISKHFALDGRGRVFLFENSVGNYTTDDYVHFKVKLAEPTLWRTEISDAFRALSKTVEVS